MTLYDFIALGKECQPNAVWQHGSFLAMRQEDGFRLALYEMDDFFVQVQYDPDKNEIVKVTPFKSMRMLEPYWITVELPEL